MQPVHKILVLLFATYALFLCFLTFQRTSITDHDQEVSQFLYTDTRRQSPQESNMFLDYDEFSSDELTDESTDELSDEDEIAQLQSLSTGYRDQKSAGRPKARSKLSKLSKSRLPKLPKPAKKAMELRALLNLLGAYPEMKLDTVNYQRKKKFEVEHDSNYCVRVDGYNMRNPANMFKNKIYFTDYANTGFVAKTLSNETRVLMNQIGQNTYVHVNYKPTYLHPAVTRFFLSLGSFANSYKVGREFLCVTQMSNHIPGQAALVAKDLVIDQANLYLDKYRDRPQCFNKSSLFPISYRLHNQTECREFFSIINSDQYIESLKDEPIQYMTKIGRDSHQGRGVVVLDDTETIKLNEDYQYGLKCGEMNKLLIAQAYISNPLLVNKVNKFDFRIYMLVASTNPLIVYYHDGFLRICLSSYNKTSSDKSVYLTNTHVSDEVKKQKNDSSENEDQNWMSFEAFQTYLLEEGVISDPNWLEKDLKPSFHRALIHLVRMASPHFWNQSNVYALHGVDFMLDDKMNLWFIESNHSPQLGGGSPVKNKIYESVFKDHLEITNKYYMSRMKRLTTFMKTIENESKGSLLKNIDKWRKEYQKAIKNRLEPEYEISKENSFKLIMDENLPAKKAYFGNLPKECIY